MSMKKQKSNTGENPVSRGRHEHQCRICRHARRTDIEEAFVGWVSQARIAKKYGVNRGEITADNVLHELAKLAFFDPRKLFNPDGSLSTSPNSTTTRRWP
jgi:hypothetical protein